MKRLIGIIVIIICSSMAITPFVIGALCELVIMSFGSGRDKFSRLADWIEEL